MSSNFDREWPKKLNRRAEEKRKKMQEIKIPDDSIDGYKSAEEERYEMQEAFDRFHKSKEWNMICMIYEAGDCLDIVIRDEENIKYRKYRCLYGHGWKKSYLTPEQLKFVQEKQLELEQEKKEVFPAEQSKKTYQWGIICRDQLMGIWKDGIITAHSPEEAERILRLGENNWNTGITVFY